MNRLLLSAVAVLASHQPLHATDRVLGQVSNFQSYHGIAERCVRTAAMPLAQYDKGDLKDEAKLCEINLYDLDVALCPKIWSTSVAIVFYDISEGHFKDDRLGFQTTICAAGKVAKYVAKSQIARLKFSMNQATTSATYTPSSLLYYHFSRYFGFSSAVPVAVWRSVDKSVLLNEVALGGRDLTAGRADLAANHAAWSTLVEALADPESYLKPGSYGSALDFLTEDGTAAYGTIYDGGGTPYGPEVNGLRVDDTAEGKYAAFLQTPVVRALNTDLPLADALRQTLERQDAIVTPEGQPTRPMTAAQLAFWMRDMAEILMIDTIMGQQDRPGNIDYREYFYWVEGGKIKRERVRDQMPGQGDIPQDAQILLRTRLNDNDASGRWEYDNHLMRLQAIEQLRHFDAGLYEKLQALDQDFQSQGPIFQWLRDSLGLELHQAEMIAENTAHVALVLRNSYAAGRLRLDLDAEAVLINEASAP